MLVEVKFKRTVALARSLEECFNYIRQLKVQVVENFPGLQALKESEPGVLQWDFERIDVKGMGLEINCVTNVGVSGHQVTCTPVPGKGNADLTAAWALSESGGEVKLEFHAVCSREISIPLWLKAIALPFAQAELTKLFEQYLTNVQKKLR